MKNIYKMLSRCPNYVKRFGFIKGLLLLFKIESCIQKQSSDISQYTVEGYKAPINLRRTIGDHSIFWQCIVQVQYDFLKFPQSKRIIDIYNNINNSLLIIDCGANIGLSVLWFARYFPEAIIYAIEPDSENFKLLQKNTEHLGEKVKCIQGAVWDKIEQVDIVNPNVGSIAFQVKSSESIDSVPTYTIDSICKLAGAEFPFIVKLDIEGAQAELFRGNTDWVGKTHLITLELDDWLLPWQGTSRSFFSCVSQYPFDYLLGGESIFCFRDFTDTYNK